jgi:hypothetical protein
LGQTLTRNERNGDEGRKRKMQEQGTKDDDKVVGDGALSLLLYEAVSYEI